MTETFRADCEALMRHPHRLSGTAEGAAAAAYMAERLEAIGVEKVIIQPFSVAQTSPQRCELIVEGADQPLALLPMRPNDIIPPTTPVDGVSGALVVMEQGRIDEFKETEVRGSIVVMDYNSGDGWMRAFRFGARAIIFVRRDRCLSENPHHAEIPANLPRFYYEGDPAALPAGAQATIHSEVLWKGGTGQNVFGFIRGTDPVFEQDQEEMIVLAAPLDSFGDVPRRAPGGRSAANAAALLKLAERFVDERPRRHVLIACFDNQARLHDGARIFYRALESDGGIDEEARIVGRERSLDEEGEFLAHIRELLISDQPLLETSPARRQLRIRLADRATEHAAIVAERSYKLRDEAHALGRTKPIPAENQARIDSINAEVTGDLLLRKNAWNGLRRALGRGETEALTPEVALRLKRVTDEVRQNILLRADELTAERATLDADKALTELVGDCWVSLHISLALGDTTPQWGVIIGGDSSIRSNNDSPGLYGKVQGVFRRAHQDLTAAGQPVQHFVLESVDQSLPLTRVLWGAPGLVHSGEVAGLFGIYNVVLGTMHERLPLEGTPDDLLEHVDLDRIEAQTDEIGTMLNSVATLDGGSRDTAASLRISTESPPGSEPGVPQEVSSVADQPGLSLRRGIIASREYAPAGFRDRIPTGPSVMGMLQGSSVPNTRMAGAVVQVAVQQPWSLSYKAIKTPAFDDFRVKWTNQNGLYELGPLYGLSAAWRTRGFAAVFDERGAIQSVTDATSFENVRYRLNVFRCMAGYTILPPQQRSNRTSSDAVKIMSSRADAVLDKKKSFSKMTDGVLCWYMDERRKGVKMFGIRNVVGLNSGPVSDHRRADEENGSGRGFAAETDWPAQDLTRQSAADLWRLNDARVEVLRHKDILDSSLSELHGRAEDLLIASESENSPLRRNALATSAFWSSRTAYNKALGVLDDIVMAVLILLGLSVPFSFALERVIIGGTTIYKQLSWFVVFFVLTFLTLYFSHPAFAIANTPIIIFLGFAIVVMSVIVIGIIMRKFEAELKAMQGMMSTVHASDVSRLSTFMAAMQMGISTMRRRPLRTALTAVTIVLLTFTILCFASFSTQSGIVKLFSAPKPAYTGAWVHDVNWVPISEDILEVVTGRWGDDARIRPRYWISRQSTDQAGVVLARADGSHPATVSGLLGIQPGELADRSDLAAVLGTDLENRVLLSEGVARVLGVSVGETVLVKGLPLTIGAVLDPVQAENLADMDGSALLPVDFAQETSTQAVENESSDEQLAAQRSWTSLGADNVVIVSSDTARRLGASLYGLTLYTDSDTAAVDITEDLARMLPFPVLGTRTEGVFRHVLGTVLAASGVGDLFFPVLLGGLVIFGTMLGSVSDREREIYTFSALGLAPRHVATLFFAEAIVYSLIGGLGGYLLAQGTVKILSLLAEYGWVRVPEMNMTSTNTIVTILIVMATVLISAVYPALKASRSANPGLMRVWKPPAPEGDVMDMVFPFTVSEYDITGVVSFLKEHFDNYSDTGLGQFMATHPRLVRDETGMLGLDSDLALSPFDLGVSQSFQLRSAPSGIPGIDEVRIRLDRHSGQPKDWARLNKVFLDDLRRQFLLWRSLPSETMEIYRERTLVSMGSAKH
ncbi:MAG: FtsX-like permease family protein [Verrucomicrobia bacterium]|nr:FtsX-like permease family protein [Verrucomicrobiota bacterium]MBT7067657.1 FtsX-like permease family protein [Verrucomicrobiota bacterium]MBT7701447.1 FtsX-like permease family protein [Verrucomicrobiota bacterium]